MATTESTSPEKETPTSPEKSPPTTTAQPETEIQAPASTTAIPPQEQSPTPKTNSTLPPASPQLPTSPSPPSPTQQKPNPTSPTRPSLSTVTSHTPSTNSHHTSSSNSKHTSFHTPTPPIRPPSSRRLSTSSYPLKKSIEIIEPIDQSITKDEPSSATIHRPVVKASSLSIRRARGHLFRVGVVGEKGRGVRSWIRRVCLNEFSEEARIEEEGGNEEEKMNRKSWTIDNHTFLLEFIPITIPSTPPSASSSQKPTSIRSVPSISTDTPHEIPPLEFESTTKLPETKKEKLEKKPEPPINSEKTRKDIESCDMIILLISPITTSSHPLSQTAGIMEPAQIRAQISNIKQIKTQQWERWTREKNWPEERSRFRDGCREVYVRGFKAIGVLNSKGDLKSIYKVGEKTERPSSSNKFGEVVLERLEERIERQKREKRREEAREGERKRLEGAIGGEVGVWECSSKEKEGVWGVVDEVVRLGRRERGLREKIEEEEEKKRGKAGVKRRKSIQGEKKRASERKRVVMLWRKVQGLIRKGALAKVEKEEKKVEDKIKVEVKDLKQEVKR